MREALQPALSERARPRGRDLRARAPRRRRLEGGVGGRRRRRAAARPPRGGQRDPPAHALARGRVRGARGGVRGGREGAAAVRLHPRSRRARGVRDGAARGRHDRPPHRPEGRARRGARGAAGADGGGAREDPRDPAPSACSFLPESRLEQMVGRARRGGRAAPGDRARALVAAREPPAARASRSSRTATTASATSSSARTGLVGVLDWEFAHLDDPVRDLAFSLVRAWRFGVPEKRLGGVGAGRAVSRALQRADRPRRAAVRARLLGARGQRRLGDRLPHADAAAPDRAGPERRARDARPARRRGRVRDRATCWSGSAA